MQTLPEEGITIITQGNCGDLCIYVNRNETCDDIETMNSQASQLTHEQEGVAQ